MATRQVVDGALLVDFPEVSTPEANRLAVAVREHLMVRAVSGFLDAIPGARTLLILFDPLVVAAEDLEQSLPNLSGVSALRQARAFRIPARYGGELGPDLAALAGERRLSTREVINAHVGAEYRVAFLGFAPGFPYLIGLPEVLHAARLLSPRPRVPAGSIGIGGEYTGVYPSVSPGGWNLIGRAAVNLFDPNADSPSLLAPGDTVRFEEVSETDFSKLSAEARPRPRSSPKTPPAFRVLRPGLYTSVQGPPRLGLSGFGVPTGGAMDLDALLRANALLENPLLAPGLEITLAGPELEVLQGCRLCLAGAPTEAELDGSALALEEPRDAAAGQRLRIGPVSQGVRSYLAITGGFADRGLPGEATQRIQKGDQLYVAERLDQLRPAVRLKSLYSTLPLVLRALPGPQERLFTERGLDAFFSSEYRVSIQSDRRGIRLEGSSVELVGGSDIPPEGTAPGSVQVPGNALPIILGPDRPVTGGYAKVATVIGADLGKLAQARPGERIRFEKVTIEQALAARLE